LEDGRDEANGTYAASRERVDRGAEQVIERRLMGLEIRRVVRTEDDEAALLHQKPDVGEMRGLVRVAAVERHAHCEEDGKNERDDQEGEKQEPLPLRRDRLFPGYGFDHAPTL
jgi:hypothetical protein